MFLLWSLGKFGLEMFDSVLEEKFFIPIPYIFGLNYKPISNILSDKLIISNCDIWFFTDFDNNATKETKAYWGKNTGLPFGNLTNLTSSGMIDGRKNIISNLCNQVGKTVPYFIDFKETYAAKNKSYLVDDYLFEQLDGMADANFTMADRNFDNNKFV